MNNFSIGTLESRRKGGLASQQRRRDNPEYYKKLGCLIPNQFHYPQESSDLAEFIGIALGDGGLTKNQLHITLNSIADAQYLNYVLELIQKLFKYRPYIYKKKDANANVIVCSGVNFTKYLLLRGLKIGNKVKLQVDVPTWIKENHKFSRSCLRGLMDTDGGIFTHRYRVRDKDYSYLKICFCNKSQPLRNFVSKVLSEAGFTPKLAEDRQVWLYSDNETRQYIKIIGSSNYRLLRQIKI